MKKICVLLVALASSALGQTATDALNRVVSLPGVPERIAIAGRASFMVANAAFLFPEARARLVGSSFGSATRQGAGDFLALVSRGEHPSTQWEVGAGVEQIASARPDLVLMKSSSARLGEDIGRLGVPVAYLDFETPAQYARDLEVLGRLLGAGERARVLQSYYDEILQRVRRSVADVPAEKRPRILLLQYSDRGGAMAFSVPPANWIQTKLVEECGGVALWKEASGSGGWTVVNFEQVAAWDPDRILLASYRSCAQRAVDSLLADAKWQALRAVREGRLFACPGDFTSWDQPDPRWGLGLLWMASRIHPELFRDLRLDSEVIRFYELYGLDSDTVRSRVMPLICEDLAALHV